MERTARLKHDPARDEGLFRRRKTALAGIFAVWFMAVVWWPVAVHAIHAIETAHVTIGGESVPYAIPEGLASVQGLFPLNLKVLDKEFFMDTKVFGMYVPKTYLDTRQQDPETLPEYYLQLSHDAFFSAHSLNGTGFYLLGLAVKSTLARQYGKEPFREKLAAVFSGAVGMPVRIDSLRYLGILEETAARLSVIGAGSALVTAAGGVKALPFLVVTTLHLVRGKVISTIQIRRAPQKDMEAFKQEALATAKFVWGWP